MLSIYSIMEASPLVKKIGIGTGVGVGVVGAAEGGGAIGQGANKFGAAFNKEVLSRINNPDNTAHLDDQQKAELDKLKPIFAKKIKIGEDKEEFYKNIRPTQLIKKAINKYQDNK